MTQQPEPRHARAVVSRGARPSAEGSASTESAAAQQRAVRTTTADPSGRITGFQAVAYTAVLGFIAALALGVFDAMIPWGTP